MASVDEKKPHVSVVVCGHIDSGKSTFCSRLLYDMGGISQRDLEKMQSEADANGKSSFVFAYFMDTCKEERARGVTINCNTKSFSTPNWYYTIIDAPGHRDFIKNMISGASQADVAILMVPADGNFTTAIAKGDRKNDEVQGQTRAHARLINLLGVKQLIVGVNKMDSDTVSYSEERFNEVANEMKHMLQSVGWKKEFVEESVPIIPMSAWVGENILKQSDKMPWWKGKECKTTAGTTVNVKTILDALDTLVVPPERKINAPLRIPLSGIYKIKGVGDVLTGRIEQGVAKPGDEIVFLPTHTAALPCVGKIFSLEMHHERVLQALPGDNVGMNIKGLDKSNMPKTGDIIVLKSDQTLKPIQSFTAQIQTLDVPNEIKVGYTPVGYVRTGHSAVRVSKINWKAGKETGNKKVTDPHSVKANELAEIVFEPQQPLMVDSFSNCEGLSRIAFLDGNAAIMLGKVVSVVNVNK